MLQRGRAAPQLIKKLERYLRGSCPPFPLISSLLTRQDSSVLFSLIRGCDPSFTGPNCLPCHVMTVTSTLLSPSCLGGG